MFMSDFDFLQNYCDLSNSETKTFEDLWNFYSVARGGHNFTAILDRKGFVVKHFIDSLLAVVDGFKMRSGMKVLDVGTGGGFPGIPLAVKFPMVNFYLLDAVKKNTDMLTDIKEKFSLKNVNIIRSRAEHAAHKSEWREQFDVVVTRAFAGWEILLELCLPFVKQGGCLLAYKGPKDYSDVNSLANLYDFLGGGSHNFYEYELPENYGQRKLVIIEKSGTTPSKYPRSPAIISKRSIHAKAI